MTAPPFHLLHLPHERNNNMKLPTLSLLLALLALFTTSLALKSASASSPSSSTNPPTSSFTSTDADQICISADSKSCYPHIFTPTLDFQPILEGQRIPPGLHVRLNVQTGEKEARLNVPMEEGVEMDIETVFAGEGTTSEEGAEAQTELLEVPLAEAREELRRR